MCPRRDRTISALVASIVAACAPNGAPTKGALPTPATASAPSIVPSASTASVTTAESDAGVDPELTAPVASIKPEEGVGLAPGPNGHIGAWLALGPFRLPEKQLPSITSWRPPVRKENGAVDGKATPIDDHAFAPALGDSVPTRVDVAVRELGKDGKPRDKIKGWTLGPATWTLVSSGEGGIDLERALGSGGKPAVAYLASVLRLPVAMKVYLSPSTDDGCELLVDGVSRFHRDASRALRDDDDFVPLDLGAGDHVVVLKLHQRDGGWGVHVRLLDASFRPPLGARWLLPKAKIGTAGELASSMSWIAIAREPIANGWSLSTSIRFPEGAPLGVPLFAYGSLVDDVGAARVAPVALGAIKIGPRSVEPFTAKIATLATKEAPTDVAPAGAIDFTDDERAAKDFLARVDLDGRRVDAAFHPRPELRRAVTRARAVLARWTKDGRPTAIPDDVAATLEYLADRLVSYVARGDADVKAQLADAAALASFVDDAEAGKDPLATKTGALRLAHVAHADGRPQPFTLYVPTLADPKKKVPLYVGLHGMNGGPMSMLRIFFGGDDEGKTMAEMERAFEGVQTTKLAAFVLAPHAHGNAMYRQLGETEVMDLVAWAIARYPSIDPDRVYITGFSMGGIGAASIPLHHPDVFAAAEPLCGYHSYAIRRDIHGRPLRPWETFLIDDRSNTEWAFNGLRLPMYVVHGTKDLPEENSGVLIDAYEKLGFSMKHDHPDKGHDVWGWAYDHLDQVKFFAGRRRDPHPKRVRFRTTRPRYGDDAWVHVDRIASSTEWAVIDARVENKHAIHLTTKGVGALHLDRDEALLDPGAVTVTLDAQKLVFAEGEPLVAHHDGAVWLAGAPKDEGLAKEGRIAGPIRDVWNEPLTFVYGASDPLQITANREVAQQLARVRWGVDVQYPMMADTDVVDPLAAPKTSIVLVGNANSNRVTRALEGELPIVVDGASLRFAGKTFTGSELGAAFVVPHPKAKQHYLLVVEGADALGTFRALSLPELLPDFVIWDARLAAARGQQVLSFGAARAAGFFDQTWKPPATFDDPLLDKVAGPKNEKDSTSYLP